MKIKTVLLADKDENIRRSLHHYLGQLPFSFLLRESGNGPDTIRYLNTFQPDLVFMEVTLPGKNGFEVLDQLDYIPPVIMMSASPEYAARAFDYKVADYLLKPFSSGRLDCAFQRLKEGALTSIPRTVDRAPAYPSRIFVEKGSRLVGILVDKITYLKADGDYSRIYTVNGESFLCTTGIGQLAGKFDPQSFIRVHRSYIVNIGYICELRRDISKLFISLPNEVQISVGRSYLPAIKELML